MKSQLAPGFRLTLKVGVSRCAGVFWGAGRTILKIRTFSLPTPGWSFLSSILDGWFAREGPPSAVFLSSVNPDWTGLFERYFQERHARRVALFSPSLFPYAIRYEPPGSLGSDRLLSILGAIDRFPAISDESFAVVDYGSHTTVTVFHQGSVVGGSIAPGIALSLGAIGGGKVVLGNPDRKLLPRLIPFPGNSTESSILAGTVLSSVRGVEGLLSDGEDRYQTSLTMFLTGGFSPVVFPLFHRFCFMDRHLLHRGAIRFLPEGNPPSTSPPGALPEGLTP